MADHDEKVAQFANITGDAQHARFFLDANNWDLNAATSSYLAAQDEGGLETPPNPTAQPANPSAPIASSFGPQQATGPASSSSNPAPASRSKPPQQKKKFGSLRDLQQAGSPSASDDSDKDQEYFAGGDKSGLAVQDPSNPHAGPSGANEHIQRLLQTARQNRARPPGPPGADGDDDDDETPAGRTRRNNFGGAGVTLGGEGEESTVIPDPAAPAAAPTVGPAGDPGRREMIERTLHLWDDGFSVDDGPLYRYDDPANERTLEMINRGSAPLDLMNVESGQAVDVKLEQHRGEKYTRPKKKYRPFEGSGQRLGAPTPGDSGNASTSVNIPMPSTASTTGSTSAAADASAKPQIDESQPTVRLQIRLADGTRLPAQFNTSATIGDVRAFVERAHSGSVGRAYVLATTFPTKDLTDETAVIGEMAELKRGGNVVQKWA
ncbi:MAG: hypothetical protein Q9159_000216 [Coniocarpon cinnabarinum]